MKAYGAGSGYCEKHGSQQIDWKCNYCCSVAVFHCFGTTYFCERCHNEASNPVTRDCGGVNCPLGVPHPPAGPNLRESTFPLGCGICRSEKLAAMKDNKAVIHEVLLAPIENVWAKKRDAEEKKRQEEQRKIAEKQRQGYA